MVAVAAMSIPPLVNYMQASAKNSKAQMSAQSLRDVVSNTLTNPATCSTALSIKKLKKQTFNAAEACVPGPNATCNQNSGGIPLELELADGTNIFGTKAGVDPAGTPLPNYAVRVDHFLFQTVGKATALSVNNNDIVDPNPNVAGATCSTTKNKVFPGDVYLTMEKQTASSNGSVSGGTGLKPEYVGTVLLTVDSTTHEICRCYSPDPCTSLGGIYNANATPSCQFCPAGDVWVGYTSTGAANCIAPCTTPGQFLVSDGKGGATCQTGLIDGTCGAASTSKVGYPPPGPPAAGLCAPGTASVVTQTSLTSPWTWTCASINKGKSNSCSALYAAPPAPGKCGTDQGNGYYASSPPPAGGYCQGTDVASKFMSTPGGWSWTCTGTGPSPTIAACSALLKVDGACPAPAAPSLIAPVPTCKSGIPTSILGTGPWMWGCDGLNNGINTSPTACKVSLAATKYTWACVANAVDCEDGSKNIVADPLCAGDGPKPVAATFCSASPKLSPMTGFGMCWIGHTGIGKGGGISIIVGTIDSCGASSGDVHFDPMVGCLPATSSWEIFMHRCVVEMPFTALDSGNLDAAHSPTTPATCNITQVCGPTAYGSYASTQSCAALSGQPAGTLCNTSQALIGVGGAVPPANLCASGSQTAVSFTPGWAIVPSEAEPNTLNQWGYITWQCN
jgi:hypothetical protein